MVPCRQILAACLLSWFLWWPETASAQNSWNRAWFVRSGVTSAFILPTNPFAVRADGTSESVRRAPNITIEVGRRTDGTSAWHELYGTPSYGFGVALVRLPNAARNGHPIETYGFFSWPFARLTDRLQVTTDFGMGLSWRWRHMNEKTDTYESVLGSNFNARLDWGFYVRYLTTPKLVMYTGLDYTHRSNAGLVQPDLGINVIGPKVALQYNFAEEARSRPRIDPPSFDPAWEVVVGGLGGLKNIIEQRDPVVRADCGTFDITAALQRHFYQFGKAAAGTDVIYDGRGGTSVEGAGPLQSAGRPWGLGVYGGYEHVIARFGAFIQVGDNVVRAGSSSDFRRLYSRYGWHYRVSPNIWSMLAIRAQGFRRANALELGFGYRFHQAEGNP